MTDCSKPDVIATTEGGEPASSAVLNSGALLGVESSKYHDKIGQRGEYEFIDWPFTSDLEHEELVDTHLDVVASEKPKYAVGPDVEEPLTLEECVEIGDRLLQHAEIVILAPKDVRPTDIPERFRIGYPNQPNFGSNGREWPKWEYQAAEPIHVFGGSPDSQFDLGNWIRVGSVDTSLPIGFYSRFGRVWTGREPHQVEIPEWDYATRIEESYRNMIHEWFHRYAHG